MMRKFALMTATAAALVLGGCANAPQQRAKELLPTEQNLRIDVLDAKGQIVPNIPCSVTAGALRSEILSGQTQVIGRSKNDAQIICATLPALGKTSAQLITRTRAYAPNTWNDSNIVGNIVLGSGGYHSGVGIGVTFPIQRTRAANEGDTNPAYQYPEWVQLRIGKHLLFDKAAANSEQPATGLELLKSP